MTKPNRAPRRQINPRRSFSVSGQLVGKLGEDGYGQLLEGLRAATSGPAKRRRRRGPRRKAVA